MSEPVKPVGQETPPAPRALPEESPSGVGVWCTEGQADGIPCHELDFNCGCCPKANLLPPLENKQG